MIKYKGQQISHAITKTQYLDIIDDLRKRKKLKILSCVLFMGTKGLRISDTLNLKIVDVFHKNGTLRSNLRFKNQKQKKFMQIPLDNGKDTYFKRILEQYYFLVADRPIETFLFEGDTTIKLSQSVVKQHLKRYKNDFGIDQLSCHSFRKYFGKSLFEQGVPIETISAIYQHADVSITRTYLDINRFDIIEAMEKINY